MTKTKKRIHSTTILLWTNFIERFDKLPLDLQVDFLADLEVAMENRLKVLKKRFEK